jgi:hypothetical protein
MGHRKAAAFLLATVCICPPSARAEIIDRVLAVVDGQIVTLSDVRAALTFGLVPPDVSADPIGAALQRLIDRRLTLAEVERYAPPEPPPADVDAGFLAIERRFKDTLAFEFALNQSAMSREELRRYVRDSLRIEPYLQQRFAAVVQPSDDDLVRYYREHSVEFMAGGRLRPLDDVREEVRGRVIDAQRARFVQQWVEGLRRRGSVLVLYLPGR